MPTLADAGKLDGWVARCLEPGEPLLHRTYATRTTTLTAAAAWSRLSKLGAEAKRYVVDFLVPAGRLVIEVDGGYHQRRRVADARRERALRRLGYQVLRLDAELVLEAPDDALDRVRAALPGRRSG